SGNTDTCSAIVTIEDNLAPIITCPDDQYVEWDPNGTYTLPDYVENGEFSATDNCTENLTITQDPIAGTILGVGVYIISFETTDNEGNSTSCSFELDVLLLGSNDYNFNEGLTIYPNPSSNLITINSNSELLTEVIIYDISGKQIYNTSNINSDLKTIDISNFSNGIYFVLVNNQVAKKLIKN
ncbi:MAG: hypothetical protein ACI93P_001179, partial [bacterium]